MKHPLLRSLTALLLCAALAAQAFCGCGTAQTDPPGVSHSGADGSQEPAGSSPELSSEAVLPAVPETSGPADPDFQDYDLPAEETEESPLPEDSLPAEDGNDYARALASKNQDRAPEQAVLTQTPGVMAAQPKTWTVMIYMIGSNLESQHGSATMDMLEMEESGLDYANANLLLYTGGSRTWKGDVPNNRNCILDMQRGAQERIVASTESNADMGAPETLSSFVNFCTKLYPAEHYMLILWDHGGGPLWGYGSDELFGSDALLLSEMRQAMQATVFGRGKKLDFVGFDACLMGCYENMALWRSFADRYIGSEELEPGDGWDYHFLRILNETTDPQAIADEVTSTFYYYYQAKTTDTYRPQVTLSCTDLTRIPQATTALRALFARLASGVQTGDYPELQRIRGASLSFGRVETVSSGTYSYDLVDLKDLAIRLAALYPSEAAALTRALNGLIISQVATLDGAGGISLFYPCENRGQFEKMASLYRTVNVSADYSRFLDSVASEWRTAKSRDWNLGELTVTEDGMELQLTEDQLQNMSAVYYTVLVSYEDGGSLFILDKCSLTPDRNGVVRIPADPMVFYLDNGGPDRYLWNVTQTGRSKNRLYYQTVSTALYTDANPLEHQRDLVTKNISLAFSTNLKGGDLKIGSVTSAAESFDTPGKETVVLGDWEAAGQIAAQVVPTRDAQGRLLPASQWNINELTSYRLAPYDGSFTFGLAPASELSESCSCQVVIEDVNGEAYASELCPVRSASYRPVTVETKDGAWDFLVHADHAALIGYTGASKNPVIPPQADGQPVTEIYAGAFGNFTLGDSYGHSPIRSITLPETVTILHKGAFQHCMDLKRINLPEGLTVIGESAFAGCSSLESLTLPSTVTVIGKSAFDSCGKLREITFPPALTLLGSCTFMNCKSLQTINGEALSGYRLRDGALYDDSGTVLLAYPCARTGSFTVPEGTETIASGAFTRSALSQVIFPEGLVRISSYAFYNTTGLAVPVFPDSLRVIGPHAFSTGFSQIHLADIPEAAELRLGPAVEEIGAGAFNGLPARTFSVSEDNPRFAAPGGNLTNKAQDTLIAFAADRSLVFTVPEGVTSFDWSALDFFDCYETLLNNDRLHFIFPDSVTLVRGTVKSYNAKHTSTIHAAPGSAAQLYAQKNDLATSSDMDWSYEVRTFPAEGGTLTARLYSDHAAILFYEGTADPVILPDTLDGLPVTVLGGGDFAILMPQYSYGDDYSELGFEPAAFSGLPDTLVLPESLTTLAAGALFGLGSIPHLDLPSGITRIEQSALGPRRTADGSNWVLPPALTYAEDCFVWDYTGTFTVTPALQYISPRAFAYSPDMAGLVQEGENETYSVRDGLLYSADGSTLLLVPGCAVKDGVFAVPEGTLALGYHSISSSAFSEITLPASLQTICENAFYSCYCLESLSFSPTDGPLVIEERAFSYCGALKELTLPEGLVSVGDFAFSGQSYLEELTLPDSLVSIGSDAFRGCTRLKNIRFGSGLTYIGPDAFYGCPALTGLTLPDSLVTVGEYAFDLSSDPGGREPFVLHLGPNLRSVGNCAFSGLPVSAFEVDPANRFYSSSDGSDGTPGLLLASSGTQLSACPSAAEGTVTFPRSVTMTLYGSLRNCTSVKEVVIPDTMLYMSSGTFTRYYEDRTDPDTGQSVRYYSYLQTIRCAHGSYAEAYAIAREIPYVTD